MSSFPQVRLTQSGKPVLNVVDLFWLPAGETYGNLLPKVALIHERIFEINRQLETAFETWYAGHEPVPSNAPRRHLFAVEYCVYNMRRVADELVGLRAVVFHYAQFGNWPESVDPDSVGQLLHRKDLLALTVYSPHRELLVVVNNLHNAQKHSFLNSDTTLVGRDEPTAYAIHRRRNRADAPVELYGVALKALAESFQSFCLDALEELRTISKELNNRGLGPPQNDARP